MHSDTNGPLTTFLLFVPLVAVPLLAVFGIPQFAPVVASPGADAVPELGSVVIEGDSARQPSRDLFSPAPSDDSRATGPHGADRAGEFSKAWNDPFRPSARPMRHDPGDSDAATSDAPWIPPAGALDEWEPEPVLPRKTAPGSLQPGVRANFDEQRQLQPDGIASVDDRLSVRHDWATDPLERERGQDVRPLDRHPDAFLPIADSRRQPARDDRGRSPFEDNPFAQLDTAADRPFNPQSAVSNQQSEIRNPQSEPPARFTKDESIRKDAAPDGSDNPQSAIGNPQSEEPLTWRSAVHRLKELDIRHFQLEPGERDEFHFSCYFTPSDNPRITHRFEAEATEPLRAVEKVLAQVEQWLEKR